MEANQVDHKQQLEHYKLAYAEDLRQQPKDRKCVSKRQRQHKEEQHHLLLYTPVVVGEAENYQACYHFDRSYVDPGQEYKRFVVEVVSSNIAVLRRPCRVHELVRREKVLDADGLVQRILDLVVEDICISDLDPLWMGLLAVGLDA